MELVALSDKALEILLEILLGTASLENLLLDEVLDKVALDKVAAALLEEALALMLGHLASKVSDFQPEAGCCHTKEEQEEACRRRQHRLASIYWHPRPLHAAKDRAPWATVVRVLGHSYQDMGM